MQPMVPHQLNSGGFWTLDLFVIACWFFNFDSSLPLKTNQPTKTNKKEKKNRSTKLLTKNTHTNNNSHVNNEEWKQKSPTLQDPKSPVDT